MGPILMESRAPVAIPRYLVYCLTPSELGDRCIIKWEHWFFDPTSGFSKVLHCNLQYKTLLNPLVGPKIDAPIFKCTYLRAQKELDNKQGT